MTALRQTFRSKRNAVGFAPEVTQQSDVECKRASCTKNAPRMARVWLSKGGASHKAESAGRRLGRSITERCIGVTGHPPVRRMRRYVLRQRRRRGVLVELETRARPSLPLCHARPSQGSDHRLDQALQRHQAALEPRLPPADRVGSSTTIASNCKPHSQVSG